MKYRKSDVKEFLVDERPPDSVDVLQGTEPHLLQYLCPVLLLQGEGHDRLLHLSLDLISLGDDLEEFSPEYFHHARTEIFCQIKSTIILSRGHFVPKPLVGGFGCLELVLYGIRLNT